MDLYDQQLGAIRRVAERAITVRDITVESVWGPSPQDGASSAAGRMLPEGFDIAPIIETPLWRYVTKDTLVSLPPDTPVAEVASTISASDLVTSNLPLADAFQLLDERDGFSSSTATRSRGFLRLPIVNPSP
jgi:CBS domain-containing protein